MICKQYQQPEYLLYRQVASRGKERMLRAGDTVGGRTAGRPEKRSLWSAPNVNGQVPGTGNMYLPPLSRGHRSHCHPF